jgi:tetratricopeptide (TPR) repeat protein
MACSSLPGFLEGDFSPEAKTEFERHLVGCTACQAAVEADMQRWALGAELSRRPDRPRAVPFLSDATPRSRLHHRVKRRLLGAAGLAVAALGAIAVFIPRPGRTPEEQIAASLAPHRLIMERLPYPPLDPYRDYDATRAGPASGAKLPAESLRSSAGSRSGDPISMQALAGLENRRDRSELIAALIARGNLVEAERQLQEAGSDDNLDVERAIVAEHKGQTAAALALLDQVLARSPRHPQALWNRAIALTDLDLPLAAAEAFDVCAALGEPGWSREAASRRDSLRQREGERARRMDDVVEACRKLGDGVIPDLDIVRHHAGVCRPTFYIAVRRATTRDEVSRLLPVAQAIDRASGDTASSALVNRIAAADFKARAPSIALYTRLVTTPGLASSEQARIVAQLRASGQRDLLLGALLRATPSNHVDELVQLAHATEDPYFDELAMRVEAEAKAAAGKALEAELMLRDGVKRCAGRDVELRCAYLHLALVELYLNRHLPTEATETARVALQRSRRLGLYWDERLLFSFLAQAAELARDYSQMRAYLRESDLREPVCNQVIVGHEAIAGAELRELRFASARAELDRASTCGQPLTLARAQVEVELVRFDTSSQRERTTRLRGELERMRRERELTRGERAHVDALEGRLLAETDPAAARAVLHRAIAAADALGFDDVEATKARNHAYRTLLLLGVKDLGPTPLELFAAAGRTQPRPGCALGAMIDGERLLLVARGPGDQSHQVFEPHAFKTPDFDARTLVPAALVTALSHCARVDVIALPPLYGQPQLLPAELAWSYRGPAGTPPATSARRPSILTIEDTRPPAALELPRLQSPSHAPRGIAVDEVVLRGPEATPDQVRKELSQADLAEFHAHGFVDLGISDVSLIALSPDLDGNFALTARVIAGLELPRAPFITLAACDAAYTAPYLHEPWSLPYAFLLAGARGVLAPATAIPDQEASSFFRAVGDQILHGADPAVVLRDQRLQRHGGPTDWVNRVVLFD